MILNDSKDQQSLIVVQFLEELLNEIVPIVRAHEVNEEGAETNEKRIDIIIAKGGKCILEADTSIVSL